jgi:putative ABC transport system ATP-binding protein
MTIPSGQTAAKPAAALAARIVDGVKVYGAGATAVRALDGITADFTAWTGSPRDMCCSAK